MTRSDAINRASEVPERRIRKLMNRLAVDPFGPPAGVAGLLQGIRLATNAHSVGYFSRPDQSDELVLESYDSGSPDDMLKTTRAADWLIPGRIALERAFWDVLTHAHGPVVMDMGDPVHRSLAALFSASGQQQSPIRWALYCPRYEGERAVGFLGVWTKDPTGFTEPTRQLAQALAHQFTNAAAATAVERALETSARDWRAEPAAANRLLYESLDRFVGSGISPCEFAGSLLGQIAAVVGVPVVELWSVGDDRASVFPKLLFYDGESWSPEAINHPVRSKGSRVPTTLNLIDGSRGRRHIIWEGLSRHPAVPSQLSSWYSSRFGVDKMINLPLVVGGEVVGAAVALAPIGHQHTDGQLELAHALAAQLALVLRLSELGERAKSVAVLEAEERLARQTTKTLGRLNEVLARGAERVASADDPKDIMVGFLREAKAATGAFCGAAYRRLSGTRHAPIAVVIDNQVLTADEIMASPVFARVEAWTAADAAGLFSRLATGEPQYVLISECESCLFPELTAYHLSVGNVSAWHLPLMRGGEYQGYIALGLPHGGRPTEEQTQLLVAIQLHMTLAFELHRLSERDRQATLMAERSRLARDIHDTLAQGFLGIILQLEAAKTAIASDPPRAAHLIEAARALAASSLNDARRSVGMLRETTGNTVDLAVRLPRYLATMSDPDGPPVILDSRLETCVVPTEIAEHLSLMIAEAIQNARRHAQASRIRITLSCLTNVVQVTVVDDGRGFAVDAVPVLGHYGLVGMRERASLARCQLTITSVLGQGTEVRIEWSSSGLLTRSTSCAIPGT